MLPYSIIALKPQDQTLQSHHPAHFRQTFGRLAAPLSVLPERRKSSLRTSAPHIVRHHDEIHIPIQLEASKIEGVVPLRQMY